MAIGPEFTLAGYECILSKIVEAGYDCVLVSELNKRDVPRPSIVLRHDVDFSMDHALRIAEVEARWGLKSTFFVMLRSPMYNLWSRQNTRFLAAIRDLGHEVGLHFDAAFADELPFDLEAVLAREVEALEVLGDFEVKSYSFHQPSASILSQAVKFRSLINTYDTQVFRGFEYISDSNMDWRGKNIFDFLHNRINVQLLTHPMWWVAEGRTSMDCWDETIIKNFTNEQRQILQTERAFGTRRQLFISREGD
ncbi:hypothetical protein [Terasakiella pusilla]|uniref:hypothetical protein n=1 Tax=Terasakiella pusilla TaxID=64973 RepID=UPI003AA7F097